MAFLLLIGNLCGRGSRHPCDVPCGSVSAFRIGLTLESMSLPPPVIQGSDDLLPHTLREHGSAYDMHMNVSPLSGNTTNINDISGSMR